MLIFKGLRFPAARITDRHRAAIPLPNGTLIKERDFVTITTVGRGRLWVPEPVDATWRSFAELDLGGAACEDFVQRRGDPVDPNYRGDSDATETRISSAVGLASGVGSATAVSSGAGIAAAVGSARGTGAASAVSQPKRQINTMRWFHLAAALRVAAENWLKPDKDGVSHPRVNKSSRHVDRRFLDHPAALNALFQANLIPAREGKQILALKAMTLAAFMVLRTVQALEERRPMKRCLQCGFWFEIRREQREPRFCSNSCRALHHQHPETAHGLDT